MAGAAKIYMWGPLLRPKDSSNRESRTLFFVGVTMFLIWVSVIICCIRYVFEAFSSGPTTITEFATAISILCGVQGSTLGIWLGRNWIKGRQNSDVIMDSDYGRSVSEQPDDHGFYYENHS